MFLFPTTDILLNFIKKWLYNAIYPTAVPIIILVMYNKYYNILHNNLVL